MELSLQEKFAPNSICYGCGPANAPGLHVRSFEDGETLVCEWGPDEKYQAFPGMLYGGLIGCLLDCHCNWTAAWHLMKANGLSAPPCTVTAQYTVKFKRPTPSGKPVRLVSRVTEAKEDRATIEGELFSDGVLCATCTGTFVAVKEGHPAYHRW
jgi:acyl-coenzyme A thioesterase PaaI-like protein